MAVTWSWPPRGRLADVMVAAGTGVFVVGVTVFSSTRGEGRIDALGWVLLVTSSAALCLRRSHPVAAVAFTLLACVLYYPLTGPGSPILLTFMVAMFSVAEAGHLGVAAVAGATAVGLTIVGEYASPVRHLDGIALFLLVGWVVASVAVGGVVRNRRAYLEEARQRAATEERLRIARELHDVLGHDISLINVQAGAALHRLDRAAANGTVSDPGTVDALAAIKDSSRRALRELRGTLGVLRQVDEDAPLGPAAGLSALPDLLARSRSAGLAVHGEVSGPVAEVPPSVDLAAYRIVQEALTNVARHADASTVNVRVTCDTGEVEVRVEDDGRGEPVGAGSGIRGMTERAEALGGSVEAGPRPDGGFRVLARLPFGGAS